MDLPRSPWLLFTTRINQKRDILPEGVICMAGANVKNHWNCYPWDAAAYGNRIYEHEALAKKCTT
jgi:hypothetical protein